MNLRAAGPGWLFCPADRPERFAKAAAAADVVILDLEDGVAEAQKPAARNALRDTPLDPERTVVRINAGGTADQARDLEALAGTAYTTVMLPKAESAAQVIELAPRDVIALVETARGAVCAAEIAAADPTVGMMWGAEDLIATLGGSSSRRADGAYRDVARHVRSTILLAASAFGRPELQLWVAACLYKGGVDVYRTFVGEMDDEEADHHYRAGMAMGTTLQVPPQMWPPDRAAFDRYWRQSLDRVHIDDVVRDYLYPIVALRIRGIALPGPLRRLSEGIALLITTGFLPQRFRDEMRLPWDATKQRRFDALMAVLRTVNRLMPRFVREFPFNLMLWDLDRRMRRGRPLV